MSIDIDYDVSYTCDDCGSFISESDAKVLCSKCASSCDTYGMCCPVYFKGVYTCTKTKRDFKWDGELPEFCPRCGSEIRRL